MTPRTPPAPLPPSPRVVPTARGDRNLGVDAEVVLNSLGVGVVVADGRGAIRYCNPTAAALLSAGDNLDAALARVRIVGTFTGWAAELNGVVGRQAVARFNGVFVADANQPPRSLCIRCSPLASSLDDSVAGVVLLIEDSGRPVEADDQIDVSRRLASLGKLAARVAHELNNPLDGILRYINLALRIAADAPEPKLKSYLAESRTGLMRMIQIVSDLLQFSRTSDAGFEDMGVNEVIEEAIRGNATAADRSNVIVAADFQSPQMPKVRGSRLYQVCCNLIRNAIDAMPSGGRLTITSGIVESEVVIRVADTGVGLPEPIERIFEPFFTTKQPGKGTGLGLAISKDFIEDMGGTIVAAQGEGCGAVFTVRVPVAGLVKGQERSGK